MKNNQNIVFRSNTVFHLTMDKTKSRNVSVLRAQTFASDLAQ